MRLTLVEGTHPGASFSWAKSQVRIGKSADNDLVLCDPAVSNHHCELIISEGHASLHDCGSRNGTLIDDVSVSSAHLYDGCVITVGETKIRCELDLAVAREHVCSAAYGFGDLVSRSASMQEAFLQLERAARTEVNVLLLAETGCGKGAAAEAVHRSGPRRDGPFYAINCGAIAPTLLKSELFGHMRGAFTGADRDRAGAFERAGGGTLFLDEIGELPLDAQPTLLRALENRTIRRLGSNGEIPIDVRIIAASNRNLRSEAEKGLFRSDLFYRLAVLEVSMPPLRERIEDLPVLVDALIERLPDEERASRASVEAALRRESTLAVLQRHHWPGNVRELRNFIERCFVLGRVVPLDDPCGGEESQSHMAAPPIIDSNAPWRAAKQRWTEYFETEYLRQLLARHRDDLGAAARAAGVGVAYLRRLLARAGVDDET